jgi:hypothetical protein
VLLGAEDAGPALIVHVCREARAAGQEELETVEMHPFHSWLETHELGLKRERVSGYLYRIHRLAPLLEELLPQMQKRWDASSVSGWTGSVLIESEVGSACVEVRDSSLSVATSTAAPTIRLRATHAQLIDMLFGQADLRFLAVGPSAQGEIALPVLAALFPRHAFRWYPKDAI